MKDRRKNLAGMVALAAMLASVLFLAGESRAAEEAVSAETRELEVSIAVPQRRGVRAIFVTGEAPHFHVVLRNPGPQPLQLWATECSWGYSALRFEVLDDAGKTIQVLRSPKQFLANAPVVLEVGAGESIVIDVYFEGSDWKAFPLPAKGQSLATKMRAIYEVPDEAIAREHGVWTGKVESPLESYRFENRR